MLRIECPYCLTTYTKERTGLSGEPGLPFTVLCPICGNGFNGEFELIDGVAASRLNKWTFGRFGTPEILADTTVSTRKRQ